MSDAKPETATPAPQQPAVVMAPAQQAPVQYVQVPVQNGQPLQYMQAAPIPQMQDLPQPLDNSHPDIARAKAKIPGLKEIGAWISAAVGGAIGWTAGHSYSTLKMLKFDQEYRGDARQDFMGKGGIGAGAADSLTAADSFGGLGRGMAGHEITEFHRTKLINSGKHPFPKMMEVIGGKGTFALATGAAGALVGYVGYKMLAPKKEAVIPTAPQPEANWENRVSAEVPAAQNVISK